MPSYIVKPTTNRINPSHPLSQGLILSLPFDHQGGTTARDISGNVPNGAALNGTYSWSSGAYGRAIKLNGSNSYGLVTVANTPLSGWTALSLGIVFRLSSQPSVFTRLFEKGTNNEITLITNNAGGNNSPLALQVLGSTSFGVVCSKQYFDGDTHAALVTITPSLAASLYTDLEGLVGTNSSGTPSNRIHDLNIGRSGGNSNFFPGLVEGFFAWNYALPFHQAQRWLNDPFGMTRTPVKIFGLSDSASATLSPSSISSTTLGTSTLSTGTVSVSPNSISSTTLGTSTLTTGTHSLTLAAISSTTLGTPVVGQVATLTLAAISSTTLGTSTLTTGTVSLVLTSISSTTLGTSTLTTGTVSLVLTSISSTLVVGEVSVFDQGAFHGPTRFDSTIRWMEVTGEPDPYSATITGL